MKYMIADTIYESNLAARSPANGVVLAREKSTLQIIVAISVCHKILT